MLELSKENLEPPEVLWYWGQDQHWWVCPNKDDSLLHELNQDVNLGIFDLTLEWTLYPFNYLAL